MNVTLIDHMGSDLSVVNAARVSFDKESEWDTTGTVRIYTDHDGRAYDVYPEHTLSQKDAKLIRYLAKHNHWTPFGHCFASFRVKAPIFVARQLGKHQVGLVWNEVSRRYVDSEPEFYVPKKWREKADNVKQGSSDKTIRYNQRWDNAARYVIEEATTWYSAMIEAGICPEQARMVLPQSMLTEWVWSGSLAAFARVCKLRLDPHTQVETRQVAEMIDEEISKLFPVSWAALMETTND